MNAEKFEKLASVGSDWWWELDRGLRFVEMSRHFFEIFGWSRVDVIGRRRTDLPRNDYGTPAWRDHLADLEARRPFRNFDTTCLDITGVSHPVRISGTPLFDKGGNFTGYIGTGQDLTELRAREWEAAERAASLRSILDNIDQGIVHFDRDMLIVAYNEQLADWLGLTQDVRGMTYEAVVRDLAARGEYDGEEPEAAIQRRVDLVRAGKKVRGERRQKDGRILSVGFTPLPDGGGIMTYSDVTEARQREARLEESEAKFRYLFQHSPMPMWVYTPSTRKILEVNDAAIAAYGYSREEFLRLSLFDLRPPEDRERLQQSVHHGSPTQLYAGEWRHQLKNGRVIEVDVYVHGIVFNGQPARLGLLIDITDRKRLERETRRIFETTQDLIAVTDSYGKFVNISPSVERILGIAPDQLIGRLADAHIVGEDLEAVRSEMRLAQSGRITRSFRARCLNKAGYPVSLAWSAVWSRKDRRYYFIGRDMTESDRTEESLRQALKMEAVGQLTGGVAHDFNNILMVIMANLDALEEEDALHQTAVDRIRNIGGAVERAAELTQQLLAFSRKQSLRPEPTDVNRLVAATARLLRRTLPETIEIETVPAENAWEALIDPAQFEAALVNLAVNARDAMPAGGLLRFTTANRAVSDSDGSLDGTVAPAVSNEKVEPGEYVVVSVSDTGEGMPADVVDKVFEPFFTTKDVGKGTGLGLSMVYGFMRQSKGHVGISSRLRHGTTVRLYLPRSVVVTSRPQASRSLPAPRGHERVLVVEDDPNVRSGVVRQIRNLGYEVVEAEDGESGLVACQEASARFDLVLTDVMMPGRLNGKAMAEEICRRWPNTRIIYMSGYSDTILNDASQLPANVMLLSKPFRRAELAATLRRALDGSPKQGCSWTSPSRS